jgi:cytochrome c
MKRALLSAAILSCLWTVPQPASAQDVEEGKAVFKKCAACHRIGEGARNSVGPALTGIVGRTAGTFEAYNYSEINKAAGAAGLVWTAELIVQYLADPNAFLREFLKSKGQADKATGSTKMTFRLPSEDERKAVVAFLAQQSKPSP